MKSKKKGVYMISFIFAILLISMVSAGLWNKITGKAPIQPQDISITVVGANPVVIEYIEPIPPQNPIESSTTTIELDVRVTDPDGVSDIDDSSVFAEFTKLGEITRLGACPWQNDVDSDTANYTCSVDMQFYDGAGTWNIKINATDFGNATLVEDTSTSFIYQELKAMVISPASLTWPNIIPSSINQTSNNDPTKINNTGNYDGEISVTSYDLLGETIPAESIPSEDFSIGIISTGANEECNTPSTATSMGVNGTTTAITNSDSNPGPNPTNYEEIYYCIPSFPLVSSQIYSTTGGSSWYVLY
jgi:hypothetical protein